MALKTGFAVKVGTHWLEGGCVGDRTQAAALDGDPTPIGEPLRVDDLLDRWASGSARPSRPLLVVPDRTRWAHQDLLIPGLLERLGGRPRVIFASGTHRPMSPDEMLAAVGTAGDRVELLTHDAEATRWASLGPLPAPDPTGLPAESGRAEVHPALVEADMVFVLSAMTFHYLAGVGGGRKMILPGLASRQTATALHAVSIDAQRRARRAGIGAGPPGGNPFHVALLRALEGLVPCRGLCVVPGPGGAPLDAEVGPLVAHHEALSARFCAARTVTLPRAVARAVVSAGGHPWDRNLVQAHKALNAIAPVLQDGARVVLAAECGDGLGNPRLSSWLAQSADALMDQLLADFDIGLQTAWSLRSLLERFQVGLVSSLEPSLVESFSATPLDRDSDLSDFLGDSAPTVFPDGAAYRYRLAA